MYAGQYVFTQVMDHLPWHVFRRCVARYGGDHKIKHFSCLDQFRCFAFAQLTWRESLRDIEACLKTQSSKLYHLGFRSQRIARNTMANANAVRDAVRDWRIYADFAQHLIGIARELYIDEALPDIEVLNIRQRIISVKFAGDANQMLGEVGVNPPVAYSVGVRQRIARNPLAAETKVIQLFPM